jgi:hypothetical protein
MKGDRMKKRKQRRNFLLSDPEGLWYDSHPLAYLISQYEKKVRKAQTEGLEAFWQHAEFANKPYKDGYRFLNDEVLSLLKEAKDGSLKAIQILIRENPKMISLPFVGDRIIDLLHQYKYAEDKGRLKTIRELIWPNFLPDRSGSRKYFSEGMLIEKIEGIMKMRKVMKWEACEILAKEVPISLERLYRMGHLGKKGRPKIRN